MFSEGMTKLIDSLSALSDDPDPEETSNIQADEPEVELTTEEDAVNEADGIQETKSTIDVGSRCDKRTAVEVSLNDNADMWRESTDQGMLSGISRLLMVNVIDERADPYVSLPSFHGLKTLVNELPPTVWINALENVPLHFGIPLSLSDDQHNSIGFEPPSIMPDGINRPPPLPPDAKFMINILELANNLKPRLKASPKVGHLRQLLCSVGISKAMCSNIYLTNFSDHSGWINDLMEINFEEVMEIAVALEGNYDRIQVETTTGLELNMANEFEADKTHTSISYHIFWHLHDNSAVFSFILRAIHVYAGIKFSFCSASFQLQSSSTLTPFWQQIISTSRTILIEFQGHFSGTLAEAIQRQFNNILAAVGINFNTCPTPFQQYFCNKSRTTQHCISQPQSQDLELIYSTAGNSFTPYQIFRDTLVQTVDNKAPKSQEELVEVIGIIAKARDNVFPLTERDRLGLRELLPPCIISFEQQHGCFMDSYHSLEKNTINEPESVVSLAKWRFLNRLHDRNETLYDRVHIDNIKSFAPIIYAPTVGLVCQNHSRFFTRPHRMYFSARDKREMMSHQVDIIVTDGSRILGLGDFGAQGIGIPIGKLDMYVATAGINPQRILPGTNKQKFLDDRLYLGFRQTLAVIDLYKDIIKLVMIQDHMNHIKTTYTWKGFSKSVGATDYVGFILGNRSFYAEWGGQFCLMRFIEGHNDDFFFSKFSSNGIIHSEPDKAFPQSSCVNQTTKMINLMNWILRMAKPFVINSTPVGLSNVGVIGGSRCSMNIFPWFCLISYISAICGYISLLSKALHGDHIFSSLYCSMLGGKSTPMVIFSFNLEDKVSRRVIECYIQVMFSYSIK
uniref:Malic enzyme N-terminal domain-containing protein n=1 Tax=Kalanchoe fedtschenkoi TaxID=63787 RepID=A0A7N0UYI1_KALFE